jgi:glycosyltransferase involved in cell wall biosynthesis
MPAPASSEFVPREGSVKVSVLVTSFNHERYIRTALDSVFAQQVSFPFEVVICDDASGDGTRAILAEIEARHGDRVRLLLPEKNLGHRGSEIFLRGLEMCAGEYIAPLDGDDCWTDVRKLQVQAGFLDRTPDCPLCFHNSLVQYEDGQSEPWTLYPAPLKERMDIENLLETASVHKSTLMFRREVRAISGSGARLWVWMR